MRPAEPKHKDRVMDDIVAFIRAESRNIRFRARRPDLDVEHAARVWGCPWAKACVQRCTPEYLQNLKAGFAARAKKIKEDKARSEEEAAMVEAPGDIAEPPPEMTE
jgi:hypothetical protein